MRNIRKRSLVSTLLACALAIIAPLSGMVASAGSASGVVQGECSVTSVLSGQLSVHDINEKKEYFSRHIEANETFYLSGMENGHQYKAIVEADDGSTYFGVVDVVLQNGQFQGELILEQIGNLPTGRSAMSIAYETESNNSIKKANTLTGNTIYGRIEKKLLVADVDYFKIVIPSDGDYAFVLDNIPNGKDYDLALYNSKNKKIATSATTADTEIIKIEDAKANEVYYAMVEGYKKASDNNNNYRLQYAPVLSISDDHGNKQSLATEIELIDVETLVGGNIDYPKDVDFFTFTAQTDGMYSVYTTGNTDTVGYVYDVSATLLAENDNGINWNFSLEVNLTAGEQYFVAVKHSGIRTGAYTLHVVQPETQGPQEPNAGNSFDTATPIDVDIPASAWFEYENDVRFFTFQPTETGSYGIYSQSNALDLVGTLYDSQQFQVMKNDDYGKSTDFMVAQTMLAGHTYYISVSIKTYDVNNQDFTIHVQKFAEPSDPEFMNQWYLLDKSAAYDINVIPMWEIAQGNNILIGVADSGTYVKHEDLILNTRMDLAYNFIHDMPNVFPDGEVVGSNGSASRGHGTMVTGLINASSNNGIGIVGVAPNAKNISLKVLGTEINGQPKPVDDVAAFINAVGYASKNGVKIINCSFGGSIGSNAESEMMNSVKNDILFVIAAGNGIGGKGVDLSKNIVYPACYYIPNGIVVAASNKKGDLTTFSNYGGPTDIAAPGDDVVSTMPFDKYSHNSGTSFSTPLVSGAVALLWEADSSLTPLKVKERIISQSSVTYSSLLDGRVASSGLLNVYKAYSNPIPAKATSSYSYENRNPFTFVADKKALITEIKNNAPNSEKTSQVILKVDNGTSYEEFIQMIKDVHQIADVEIVQELEIINALLLQTSSIDSADQLVDILNSYNVVVYAEPNYLRGEF